MDRNMCNRTKLLAMLLIGSMSLLPSVTSAAKHVKPVSSTVKSADLVILNATVHTVNEQQPWAEALAIKDGRLIYVGNDGAAQAYITEYTRVVDLDKKLIMPGFQDAHIHPMEGASLESFMGCNLVDISANDSNPENWIDDLVACKEIESPHNWILGGGHDHWQLLGLKRLPKEILDDAFPNTPAAFMEKSSHSMWVNSKALEVIGITKDTAHPQGGKIGRDPLTGEPSGILYDSAGDELMHKALAKTPALQKARYGAIQLSQDLMSSVGITSAVNARVYWTRGSLEPWLKADKDDILTVRNIMSLWTYPHLDDDYQLGQIKAMYSNDKESLLRVSKVKFYADGVPDLNSAAVLNDYGHLVHDQAELKGGNYFTGKRMAKYIAELEKVGFSAIIHAIGDRGVRESLNAIAWANKSNPTLANNKRHHYITHVSWVHPSDIPRFAALNIPADAQLNYEMDMRGEGVFGSHPELDEQLAALVPNNQSDLTPLPELYQSGARITLSSDWDVSHMNPLVNIQNATTVFNKVMPPKDLVKFAVKAYTLDAAYVLNQQKDTGSIEVGKYADMVVLDQNIFTINKSKIHDSKVLMTFLAGEEVYIDKAVSK